MATLIDCEALANKYFSFVKSELQILGKKPYVHLLLATDQPDSVSYAKAMTRKFSDIGIDAMLLGATSSGDLEKRISDLNSDSKITGGFVFYPINFPGISDHHFMKLVDQHKDIEGMSPENIYRLLHFKKTFDNTPCRAVVPCTPRAVVKTLKDTGIEIKGSDILIVNNSYAIGKPLTMMLNNLGATVTACDVNTKPSSIKKYAQNADTIITAVPAKIELFDERNLKKGANVINCSFENNFDPEKISQVANFISYRSGANYIGKVTTAMAAMNVLNLLKYQMYVAEKR